MYIILSDNSSYGVNERSNRSPMKLHDSQPGHHIVLQGCLPEVGMSARALHERVRVTKRVNVVDGSPVEPEIRLCGIHGMRRSSQYAGNNNRKASPQHFP